MKGPLPLPCSLRVPLAMLFLSPVLATLATPALHAEEEPHPLEFIDLSIENASPLWHGIAEDGTVELHLLYDHELPFRP